MVNKKIKYLLTAIVIILTVIVLYLVPSKPDILNGIRMGLFGAGIIIAIRMIML